MIFYQLLQIVLSEGSILFSFSLFLHTLATPLYPSPNSKNRINATTYNPASNIKVFLNAFYKYSKINANLLFILNEAHQIHLHLLQNNRKLNLLIFAWLG